MAIDLRSLANAVRRGLRMLQLRPPTEAPPVSAYPGDFTGRSAVRYAPRPDGDPDPGEVVWTWVPYEEDHSKGKDRPVLLVGRHGPYLLGLMMTSRDRVAPGTASDLYVDLGSGAWDKQGRASEVRLDRVLQIRPDSVRREGAVLDKMRFEKVASGLRRRHGWT
ncbi:type II toxin-antitoxin system PemK/MazF family toxin [Pseudarthrobacter sp. NPDC058196]|uniref:type II toxin-antitoxin system PemK/MazF family toxin n=1 Tax=Pseudarthrobacter sp. NPDC058196 TaxID=3346376 RepID=UPI0036DDFE40